MKRIVFLTIPSLLAAVASVQCQSVNPNCSKNANYPNIAETAYASPQAVEFFHRFFVAKSTANTNAELELYSTDPPTDYYDSTLGIAIGVNRTNLVANLTNFFNEQIEHGCHALSYPLRIVGDTVGGALVYSANTPSLLGDEIRDITSFDFINGTIRRQCDNWDGRDNNVTQEFLPSPPYPTNLGLEGVAELAAPQMQKVAHSLNAALSTGNITAASALFNYNAVFEDLTLRARLDGQIQITSYLQRVVHLLPYGVGTKVFHVLGSATGGGYEWTPADGVRHGITALELDSGGTIMRLTAVWDGARVSTPSLQKLAQLVLDP